MEKIWKLLLFVLGAILILIGYFWTMDVAPHMTGMDHPDFKHMLLSGPNQQQTYPGVYSGLFGMLMVSLCVLILFVGMRKRESYGHTFLPMLILAIGFLLAFAMLFYLDYSYEPMGKSGYYLGYPPATAWMLFVIWPYAALFSLVYIRNFHSWVMTDEDMDKFKAMVKASTTDQ